MLIKLYSSHLDSKQQKLSKIGNSRTALVVRPRAKREHIPKKLKTLLETSGYSLSTEEILNELFPEDSQHRPSLFSLERAISRMVKLNQIIRFNINADETYYHALPEW